MQGLFELPYRTMEQFSTGRVTNRGVGILQAEMQIGKQRAPEIP